MKDHHNLVAKNNQPKTQLQLQIIIQLSMHVISKSL